MAVHPCIVGQGPFKLANTQTPLFLAARPWHPSRWVREAKKNQPGGACWGFLAPAPAPAPPRFFLNFPYHYQSHNTREEHQRAPEGTPEEPRRRRTPATSPPCNSQESTPTSPPTWGQYLGQLWVHPPVFVSLSPF